MVNARILTIWIREAVGIRMSDQKSTSLRDLFLHNRRVLFDDLRRRVGREDAPDLLQETFARG